MLAQQLGVARIGLQLLQPTVLADRHELHLRRDDALTGVVHLGHVVTSLGATGRTDVFEAQTRQLRIVLPGLAVFGAGAGQLFGIPSLFDPA